MKLTREKILAISDVIIDKLTIPEWGGDIYVKTISVEDRVLLSNMDMNEDPDAMGQMVFLAVCDKDGNRIFLEEDIPKFRKRSIRVMEKICRKIADLNGLRVTEVDDAEKNS